MESFLRKYMWAINFGLLGLGALFSALLINGFVATKLARFTVPEMPRYQQSGGADGLDGGTDRSYWVDAMRQRCLFGCPDEIDPSICPDGCPDGEICDEGQCIALSDEEEYAVSDVPLPTELNLKLMGVMVAQNARWSMAMIRDQSENRTHVVGVGGLLPFEPPVEVIEIRRDRVFLDNNGQLEFIRLVDIHDGDPTAGRQQARQDPQRRTSARERQEQQQQQRRGTVERGRNETSGVVAESDNRFTVDSNAIRSQLEDPAALQRQARIMPNYRDGEPHGLRLVGVTPNSLYSQLGIRSGDVIHSVNGTQITNQRQAMELLENLAQQGQVTIEVERRGRTQKMEYNIR